MTQQDLDRYGYASHAIQAGVAMEMQRGTKSTDPKHLRVGLNIALCDESALVRLLVERGIITDDEWHAAVAAEMEREVQRYEERLKLPPGVKLGGWDNPYGGE